VVTLILLVGIAVLLFAMEEARNSKAPKPSREDTASEAISTGVTESGAIGSSLSSIPETPIPVTASLSNDQDHDGNYDGIADPLIVLCALIIASCGYVVLPIPSMGGLLLKLCDPPILVDSDYHPAIEHPG
jgi:hypothetical protein